MRDSKILHCAIKIPCWYDDNFYYILELCGDGPDTNGYYTGGFGFTRDGVAMALYYVKYDLYLVCKDKTKITRLPNVGVYNTAREPSISLSYTDAEETENVYFYEIGNNPDDEVKELPYVKDGVLIDRIRVRTGINSNASNSCFWHEFSAKQEHKITIEGNISNYKIVKTDIHLSINGVSNGDFSREEKETLSDGTAKVIARLICDSGDEHESQHILTGYDSIKSLTYTDERYVPDQGWIGQFVARTLEGDFQKQIKDFNIENKNIELQLGVFGIDDSHNINAKTNVIKTWHSFGNFMITKPQDDNVSDNLKFTSMDYTKFFNQEFNGDFTNFRFPESLNTKVIRKETYTPFWLAQYVCEQVGVELGNTEETFVNASFELHNNPFQNKETCRDVMKEIAKLSLSWVRIDWDNKCYVEQLPQFDEYVSYENYNVLVPDFYFTLETQNKKYGPINKVVFGMEGIDGESVYVDDKDSIYENGECPIYIYNNPLLDTYDIRDLAVQSVGATLFGIEYMPLKCETVGHPWMKPSDNIIIWSPRNEEEYITTYPFNIYLTYNGHIKTTIESIGETNVEATYAYESGFAKELKNAMIKVDKQEGIITEHTSRLEVVEDEFGNYYTIEKTNELINDAKSGLTNTYTTSGGNNLIKNSGLYFEEGDGFEYWEGRITVQRNVDSASGNSMILQGPTDDTLLYNDVTQTVANLPSGEYTISFGYNRLNDLATASVIINNVEYPLGNQGKFEQSFTVDNNTIIIDFRSNLDNAYEVWELMCNKGNVSLPWTQHANEVRTDMVNISKGITIESSAIKSKFKADADGIRIENQSENKTTEFTDDGMETDVAVVRKRGEITGALFTKVGEQTWINGL